MTKGIYDQLAQIEENSNEATPTETGAQDAGKARRKQAPTVSRTESRHHDTVIPSYPDAVIETIRKAVRSIGKEAATFRFTKAEKSDLADIVYTYKRRNIRTSENEITRAAINLIVQDYRANGKNSVLARVIERLNA